MVAMKNQPFSFIDLDVWKEGRKLTNVIYTETKNFPIEEKYGLTSQMRRASVSIIANVAEGFGRVSIKEKVHFYNQAHGSLTELQSHTYIASDLNYLKNDVATKILSSTTKVQEILLGLLRSTKNRL